MQDQLNRIEAKLDDALKQGTTNAADIAWLKRFVGAVATLITTVVGYLYRRHT